MRIAGASNVISIAAATMRGGDESGSALVAGTPAGKNASALTLSESGRSPIRSARGAVASLYPTRRLAAVLLSLFKVSDRVGLQPERDPLDDVHGDVPYVHPALADPLRSHEQIMGDNDAIFFARENQGLRRE